MFVVLFSVTIHISLCGNGLYLSDCCGQVVHSISHWMSAFNSINERLIWYNGQSMKIQQYNKKKAATFKAKTPMWQRVQRISVMYLIGVISWMCSVNVSLSRTFSICQGGFSFALKRVSLNVFKTPRTSRVHLLLLGCVWDESACGQ